MTLLALLLVAANLRPALASLGPVLEALRTDLQLSRSQAGYLSSIPIVCMGLFAPLALTLQKRLGMKRGLLFCLWLLTMGTALRVISRFDTQLLSALMVGIAVAALGPLLSGYVRQSFGLHSSRISAWTTTALCLSASAAATWSADLAERLRWPMALASFSLFTGLSAVMWWRTAPALPMRPANHANASPWKTLRGWLLLLCFGGNSLVFYALLTWLAPLLMDAGLNTTQSGHLLGWFTLLQIAGTLAITAYARPQRDRRMGLLLCGALTLIGLLGLRLAPLSAVYVWLALLGMGTAGLFALNLILPLDFTQHAEEAAAWTAMMSTGGYLIAAVGPWWFGRLRDITQGYDASLTLLCVTTMGAMLCGAALNRSTALSQP